MVGTNLPIGILIITEITPGVYRGRISIVIQLFITLGKLHTLILAYYLL
jgi:hypothetical protein